MESITEIFQLSEERRALREKRFAESERNQIAKHNELMNSLKATKDETTRCKENISKNLELLMAHRNSVDKLIHDSKPDSCLPISDDAHRETLALFTEVSRFLNNPQNVHEELQNNNQDYDVDLMSDMVTCTNNIGSGLLKARSLTTQTKTLKQYSDVLQERYDIIGGNSFSFFPEGDFSF